MDKKEMEEILYDVKNMLGEGVDVTIPRKNAAMLLGTVVVANMVTIALCGIVSKWAKDHLDKVKATQEETAANESITNIYQDLRDDVERHSHGAQQPFPQGETEL